MADQGILKVMQFDLVGIWGTSKDDYIYDISTSDKKSNAIRRDEMKGLFAYECTVEDCHVGVE